VKTLTDELLIYSSAQFSDAQISGGELVFYQYAYLLWTVRMVIAACHHCVEVAVRHLDNLCAPVLMHSIDIRSKTIVMPLQIPTKAT
jgi:hypothetical protein